MQSKRQQEGYLYIYHPDGVAGPSMAGPNTRTGTYESATSTCSHCHAVVVLRPNRSRERAWCSTCDHYVCDGCGMMAKYKPCLPRNIYLDRLGDQMVKVAK